MAEYAENDILGLLNSVCLCSQSTQMKVNKIITIKNIIKSFYCSSKVISIYIIKFYSFLIYTPPTHSYAFFYDDDSA